MNDILGLVALFFLVLINGFFVAAEFALVSVRRTRIEQLANEGNFFAKKTHRALKDLDLYIAATQLGITMASLGIGFLAEPAIEHLVAPTLLGWDLAASQVKTISFIIAFTASTALHIVFGELAPKSLALQRAEQVAMAVSIPWRCSPPCSARSSTCSTRPATGSCACSGSSRWPATTPPTRRRRSA
jgi:CBS domain containing-hemolysin-like protein